MTRYLVVSDGDAVLLRVPLCAHSVYVETADDDAVLAVDLDTEDGAHGVTVDVWRDASVVVSVHKT